MATLLQELTEHVELMSVKKEAGSTQDMLDMAASEATLQFMQTLEAAPPFERSISIEMIKLLKNSSFNTSQRQDLMAKMAERSNCNALAKINQSQKATQKPQSMINFHVWPHEKLRSSMGNNTTVTYNQKLTFITGFLMDAGAMYLNEPSLVNIIACWLALEEQTAGMRIPVEPLAAHQRLTDLKAMLHCYRARYKLPHFGEVNVYPSQPN